MIEINLPLEAYHKFLSVQSTQKGVLMNQKTEENCIFCKIVKGEIPSWTIYEDGDFKAFLDISPASKGHVILIPKNHSPNLYELPEEDASNVLLVAKKIAIALKETLRCDGINILQNNGECAGQTEFHFHIHIIPRYQGDSDWVNIKWSKGVEVDFPSLHKQIIKGFSTP